jgi:hypothetical protein
MNTFQINKLSHLHNGKDIIFCKTDFLKQEFNYIKSLKSEVVLISGNSDHPINDDIISLAPSNIKKWFAQNAISKNEILEPIPIGIANKNFSNRDKHGVGYNKLASEIEVGILEQKNKQPIHDIYCYFNLLTNYRYRARILDMCKKSEFINIQNHNLKLSDYFKEVGSHRMSVCPIGNGIDTHRLWEVLYCNRIPITFKVGDFKIYELYEKLPIIVLNKEEDILNKELIENEYQKQIKKINESSKVLEPQYWIYKVLEYK